MHIEKVRLTDLQTDRRDTDASPARPVILIVDDEKMIADTLAEIFTVAGFTALCAYDALEALEIASVIPPNVLLTDVVMPKMSGIELAVAIRARFPECHVLLFSGQATTAELLSKAESEGNHFEMLAKPVHPDELMLKVGQVIANHK